MSQQNERSQISKEVRTTYVVKAGDYTTRYLDYDPVLESLPNLIKVYGLPVSIEQEDVWLVLETME